LTSRSQPVFNQKVAMELFGIEIDPLRTPLNICYHVEERANEAIDFYKWLWKVADPRVVGYPLMNSPFPVAFIGFTYLVFCVLGPFVMRDKKPYNLRWLIVTYNLAMSAINLYMATKTLYHTTKLGYSYICRPILFGHQPSTDYDEMEIVWIYYVCFLTKMIDFTDTVFFVLRKKTDQLTFLHVYHHISMFGFWWVIILWLNMGAAFQVVIVNGYVHFLMYLYYGLAAAGPAFSKYLWWKKYLTMMQLIQFVYCAIGAINHLRIKCPMPDFLKYTCLAYMVSLIILFGNFYYHAYRQKKRLPTPTKEEAKSPVGWNKSNGTECARPSQLLLTKVNSPADLTSNDRTTELRQRKLIDDPTANVSL